MGNLLRYLTSFETKDSAVLPNVGDDYTPEEEYENPFGGFTKTLKNTFAKLTSANQHATAGYYWAVAVVLGVITVIEIWAFDLPLVPWLLTTFILFLAVLKFILVVAFYMHLRFDSPKYTVVFTICMFLGISIFTLLLFLSAFYGFFSGG